jgi:excisionase family DNA binding protein
LFFAYNRFQRGYVDPVSNELPRAPIRPLLTVGELLRIIPVSSSTLTGLIDSGRLPAIRIGKRRFFAPDAVERFLHSCGATPTDGEAAQ